jgi:hypothetical protein
VGQFGNIPYMFLIDIPFKGCQGRSNRSSIVCKCMRCQWSRMHHTCGLNDPACILNFFLHRIAVCKWFSVFEVVRKFYCVSGVNATCMRCQWPRMHRACGVNGPACGVIDTACIVPYMRCQWHRMHFWKFEYLRSWFRIYIRKGFSPLIRDPGRIF